MCLMSLKMPPKLSVAFFCEFFFIYFWLPWVFAAAVRGLLSVVASLDAERGLQGAGFSGCGAQDSLLCGMCYLPCPGIEPVPPASAGRFLSTGVPGKFLK